MKKLVLIMMLFILTLTACGKSEVSGLETIKVASHTDPMTTMLEMVKDDLEEKGYNLELIKVSDNVQSNIALKNVEVDANFFQHEPFMNEFNKGNNANLVKAGTVYNALVAFYSKTVDSLDELPDNAIVAVPNDPTNIARALRMLDNAGLITLDDKESYTVNLDNIIDNPKNLVFKQWDLLNLNEAYQESDLTFNYPTYIQALDLKPEVDGLILEPEADQTFAITITAREDNVDSEKIKALVEALNSDEIREFIENNLAGHAKVAF